MWLADRHVSDRGAAVVDRLDLLRVTFPHSDLVIGMSENQHGVSSSRAEGERLRDPDAQGAALVRKRFRLRVLSRLFLVTLVAACGLVLLII
jgi:hypothetical protein